MTDDYGPQHLAEHLYLAKRYDDLHTLVEDRKWYIAKRELDPSHQMYAEDVSHSLSASAHQLENAILFNDWHVAENQLPTLLARALLYATVRSQVSRVDPATLETLGRLGESKRAIRQAELLLDPLTQAEAYYRIGMALYRCDQTRTAQELMKRAASATIGLEVTSPVDDLFPLQSKIVIALYETGDEQEAEALLTRLRSSIDQLLKEGNAVDDWHVSLVRALVHLGKLSEALALVQDFDGEPARVRFLSAIASNLVESGNLCDARGYLEQAVTKINDMQDPALIRDLASGLAKLGEFDRARHMADKLADRDRVYALALMGQTAASQDNDRLATSLFEECLCYIQTNGLFQEVETCVRVAQAMMQAGHKQMSKPLLLSVLDAVSEDLPAYHTDSLSVLASTLADADLSQRASEVMGEVLARTEGPIDDWAQTEAFASIANMFTQIQYNQGLDDLSAYARGLSDHWQKAYLLAKLADNWAQVGNRTAAEDVMVDALEAADKEGDLWRRGLALVAVAESLQNLSYTQRANLLLRQVETMTEQFDSKAERGWVLAAVAKALAAQGQLQRATEEYKVVLDALAKEEDPNIQARAVAAVSQMATSSVEIELLNNLATIARAISEEFLVPEGLFSVAYAMAEQDRRDEAWTLFREAIEVGHWRPLPVEAPSRSATYSCSSVDPDWALTAIRSIGWPSAQAAGLCALVSLLAERYLPRRLPDLLELVHDIPRGHDKTRALALWTIAQIIKRYAPSDRSTFLNCSVEMFRFASQQDRSTVWATIGAILSILADYLGGPSLVQAIWQKLLAVDKMFAPDPIGSPSNLELSKPKPL